MLEEFLTDHYNWTFEAFNGASAADQQEVVEGLNGV